MAQNKEWSISHIYVQVNSNHLFLQYINTSAMVLCLLAKLAYFLLRLQEKYFLVFSFCNVYQLVVLLVVTAWSQDQTSLDNTHVWMENSITQQKQWPEAFESK